MKPATIGFTKLQNSFIGKDGETVQYNYIELEIAPNVYATISLKESNMRVIAKYAPNMYQLITSAPLGTQYLFNEIQPANSFNENSIKEIYSGQNEL